MKLTALAVLATAMLAAPAAAPVATWSATITVLFVELS